MSETSASQIAATLRDIATLLELGKGNGFRAAAFERGADAVEALGERLAELIRAERLLAVPGIGKGIAAQITEIASTGRSRYLDKLEAELPAGALALARIPELGLPTLAKLSAAGIRSPAELAGAIERGTLGSVRGFGPKTIERLRAKLARPQPVRAPGFLLAAALESAAWIDAAIPGLELAGEARRGCEVVAELVLLADHDVLDAFVRLSRVALVDERGTDFVRAHLSNGLPVRLHVATDAATRFRLIGSAEHVAKLPPAALEGARDEREIYARAGHAYLPPELREPDEPLPSTERRLLVQSDLRGLVHCHSTWSDGRATIEELARAAEARGMQYLTITDHSPTAHYAGGVELDRLARQWDEIAAVQERVGIRLLRGTESDILRDGALDYPDSILEQLDVVIASIHNRYQLDSAAMTARIIRAMRHPCFKIWGHALGRILLKRPPIACDLDAILEAVAASRAAIELNADPYRMDLPPLLAKRARALGIQFVISVDAHSVAGLGALPLGVTMARRAGLEPTDVLNTLDATAFAAAVKP